MTMVGCRQLVATKILRPRCPPGLIERARLLALADQVRAKQVAVIKAGAGFGKTSVAAGWAERLQQSTGSVAWLSLDADDDEPTRFFFYVSFALRGACDRLGEAAISLISDVSLVPLNTIVSSLINELAEIEEDVYLFLDDYHYIGDTEIHNALSFLLKYVPPRFHLVLTTRVEPALPLARLRGQNRLLEIDAPAIRFDLEETQRFVEHERLGSLNISVLNTLHTKTEGWPAVLRIVAVASGQSGVDFAQYVQGLSGTLRPISAYLAELLDGLPRQLVQFMLRTAILDRFSAPLCKAVSEADSSQALLQSIEARQLLLVPLDQEGRWYRYHPLMADHLARAAEAHLGDELPELHRRAYQWYASNELWTDAVKHAIAAGDADQAATWIENCAMALVKTGDLLTLLSWHRLFPATLMRPQINVRLAIAWGMALAMRFDDALRFVSETEQDIRLNDVEDAEVFRCECQTIRSVAIALKDDSKEALAIAEPCLETSTDPWTVNVASNVVRFGRWKSGDLAKFYATPWIPFSSDEEPRNVFASVYRLCLQGLVEVQQLRLELAERYYLDALRQAEQHAGAQSVAAALAASLIAQLRYEQGRFQEAETMVVTRLPMINATGMLECVLSAYISLARVSAWRMNIERAYALLDQAESLAHTRQWLRLLAAVLAERLRLYLSEGRELEADACLSRLERLAIEHSPSTRCAWSEIRQYYGLGYSQAALAHNRVADALDTLRTLRQEAEAAHSHYFALRLATQISVALLAADDRLEAENTFRKVLSAAAQSGIHQMILDQGPEVGNLLTRFQHDAQRTGRSREILPYVRTLIARWRELYQPEPTSRSASAVAESLSPRERSILELIGRGQSNKEIARDLGITPETVKSHVKNIFIKLAVERRGQAASRAQSLGLLRVME
jgi:ATP/maltotriose-dependent transcriptional regulator MalT